jgi:hypothetical protein
MQLTKLQRTALKYLMQNEGSKIVFHKRVTGANCYRFLTNDAKPLRNFQCRTITKLVQHNFLIKQNNFYILK